MKYLFDSNILIDHLRNVTAATAELKRYSRESKSISVITWIEVMAGVNPTTESVTRGLLEEFIVLSMSDEVAERTAVIRRERRLKLPDAIIWATAEVHGRLLVTRNSKDFPTNHPAVRIPYVL